MNTLEEFKSGDGAHCGLTDWYPEKEAALSAALAVGAPFDTGWYGSKKEIASARIFSGNGKTVEVEVSVSDDFDTPGYGEATAAEPTLESVAAAIMAAWVDAERDQKGNRVYVGYSLSKWTTEIPEWTRGEHIYPRETRKRYPRKRKFCLDDLILPTGDRGVPPPGDYYSFWGWQNDCRDGADEHLSGTQCVEKGIPTKTVAAFEEFALAQRPGSLRIGDWEIAAWGDE